MGASPLNIGSSQVDCIKKILPLGHTQRRRYNQASPIRALLKKIQVQIMARITGLNVNGTKRTVDVDPSVSLLSVLRDNLDLTGTKYGCGEGRCGACTVLMDGQLTRSCVTPIGRAAGKQITTIEGLAKNGKLTPLQEAFIKADAMECAFCTSGMIMAASALITKNARPSRDEIVSGMNRNICRCGIYQRIIEAIQIATSGDLKRKEVTE